MLNYNCCNPSLGLATKAKTYKGAGQEGSLGVTSHAHGSVRECEIMNLHTPKWTPTLGVRVPMDSQIFREYKGQNPLNWKAPYIIGKPLECRYLKWACMTHLDTLNTSYGQKKCQKSNWQFDSWPLKVRNCPDFLAWKWHATYHWKALDEGYNFVSNLISISLREGGVPHIVEKLLTRATTLF
jgi:hypothetical protein